jgi:hypothetical protein
VNVRSLAYLKTPDKIRAALINMGGPRLSLDKIERELSTLPRGDIRPPVDEPTERDAVDYRIPSLCPQTKAPKPRRATLITPEERARIAKLAAAIPNKGPVRAVPQPKDVGYGESLARYVMHRAGLNSRTFFAPSRRNRRVAAAAALVAVLLREDGRYSYPMIARILRRKDHTTIVYAVQNWPRYAEQYPEFQWLHNELSGVAK